MMRARSAPRVVARHVQSFVSCSSRAPRCGAWQPLFPTTVVAMRWQRRVVLVAAPGPADRKSRVSGIAAGWRGGGRATLCVVQLDRRARSRDRPIARRPAPSLQAAAGSVRRPADRQGWRRETARGATALARDAAGHDRRHADAPGRANASGASAPRLAPAQDAAQRQDPDPRQPRDRDRRAPAPARAAARPGPASWTTSPAHSTMQPRIRKRARGAPPARLIGFGRRSEVMGSRSIPVR